MALKDKTSLYDLVGDGPVGNMLTQQGQPFNLGMDSEFHAGPDGPNPNPTSLTEVYSKAITENNSFLAPQGGNPVSQDLNGLPGPSFNLGTDSEFHAGPDGPNPNPTSLTAVYSKAITENVAFLAPQSGNPVDQDLDGLPGPSFNLGLDSTLQQDSLLSVYNGTHGDSQFTAGPVPLPGHFMDLNGGLPSTGKYENNGPDGGYY